jgi:hypothetical protein
MSLNIFSKFKLYNLNSDKFNAKRSLLDIEQQRSCKQQRLISPNGEERLGDNPHPIRSMPLPCFTPAPAPGSISGESAPP